MSITDNMEVARAQRDSGMGTALDHADRVAPGWSDAAYEFLVEYAQRHHEFISEDVSDASRATQFPQPPTDRAWGAVYRRALKNGIIKQIGIGRSRRRHASICPRWGSV